MRELVFKSLTSAISKKRDLCIQEVIEKDGVIAKTEKRCLYFILGKVHVEDANDIEKLDQLKSLEIPYRKKHFYVLKVHNTEHGEDKLICKAAGTFYVVYNNDIYCIAFIHSFKIEFIAVMADKGGDQ